LFQVNFWHHQYGCFLQRSIYHRAAVASSFVAMVEAIPYKLFLKVPWVNKWLASSDFTFRTRKKASCAKIGELEGVGAATIWEPTKLTSLPGPHLQ
jgi:hypothetical protein